MATHDYNLANQDGASFRSDLNNALAAIVSNNSSSTAPATTFAHQIWVDTTSNVIRQRNAANDAWVELWRVDGGFNAKTFSSDVTLNAQSDLRFADSDSSNWVAFKAPPTISSNVTWELPASDGTSGQVIQTNGSGVLTWTDAGGVTDNITEGNTSAEVVDTGSNGHFKVITEGTEALRIDSSQRVGVGTENPASFLHVDSDNTYGSVVLSRDGGTASRRPFGIGISGATDANLRISASTDTSGANAFATQLVDITADGKVGLGTTSPDDLLHLSASNTGIGTDFTLANNLLRFEDTDTTQSSNQIIGGLLFEGNDSSSGAAGLQAAITGTAGLGGTGGGEIRFYTAAVSSTLSSSSTERAKIDSSGNFSFDSGYGSAATAYGCRAWAKINGTGTVSIAGSGGLSSVTDSGTGTYVLNLTPALPDYVASIVVSTYKSASSTDTYKDARAFNNGTTSAVIYTYDGGNTLTDHQIINAALFR